MKMLSEMLGGLLLVGGLLPLTIGFTENNAVFTSTGFILVFSGFVWLLSGSKEDEPINKGDTQGVSFKAWNRRN